MTFEARSEFWSISIYRHHVGPRGNLYVPNEGSFQIPLKTNDVLLESRIDEHWNVDGGQELSGPWTGFTRLSEKPPNGYTWSWGRLTKIQATSRPEYVCPEVFSRLSKAVQQEEKQHWAIEKPKLDKARMLRVACNTDLNNKSRAKSWNCHWNPPRVAKCSIQGTVRPAAQIIPILAEQDTLVSLRPTNLRERA